MVWTPTFLTVVAPLNHDHNTPVRVYNQLGTANGESYTAQSTTELTSWRQRLQVCQLHHALCGSLGGEGRCGHPPS